MVDEKRPLAKKQFNFPDDEESMYAEYVKEHKVLFSPKTVDENNILKISKHDALIFIGVGVHLKFDSFRKLALSDEMKRLFQALNYKQPAFFDGQIFQKHADHSNRIRQHQDAYLDVTEPPGTAGTLWFALTDAPADGGCMEYVPESHINYPLKKNYLDVDAQSIYTNLPDSAFVKAPVEAGSLLIHHSYTIHRSAKHIKPGFFRRAATLSFYDKKVAIRKELPYWHRGDELVLDY
ncbi:hypothetical protein B4U79_16810 [Dinothrombium tinctorium]|uniref:Phytanoyl-CoA dioxygenase domain-containing protein 1-like protein n=1 Tax=Dinothrombium tinctorium TaxID=1965070 RepID=A0A3S3NSA4_9ACAR|nr:hypothetical protein B4U79_16810 [Dinothrombium tinctorium]